MRHRCTIKNVSFPWLFPPPYECCTWLPFGLNLPYFSTTLNIILHTQIWGYQWWLLLTMEVQEDKHSNSGANNGLMSQALQIRFVFASCPLLWYSGYNYEAPLHHQNVSFTWLFLHLMNVPPDWLPFGPNAPYFIRTLNIILHTQIWGYLWWLLLTMEVQEDNHSNNGANSDVLCHRLSKSGLSLFRAPFSDVVWV
jgi:hypothetical protein